LGAVRGSVHRWAGGLTWADVLPAPLGRPKWTAGRIPREQRWSVRVNGDFSAVSVRGPVLENHPVLCNDEMIFTALGTDSPESAWTPRVEVQ